MPFFFNLLPLKFYVKMLAFIGLYNYIANAILHFIFVREIYFKSRKSCIFTANFNGCHS